MSHGHDVTFSAELTCLLQLGRYLLLWKWSEAYLGNKATHSVGYRALDRAPRPRQSEMFGEEHGVSTNQAGSSGVPSGNHTLPLAHADLEFLVSYLPQHRKVPSGSTPQQHEANPACGLNRPFVTLTYACSLDGMISLAPGVRTTLSGPETKSMTHYLRLHHDAILVGVGTAVADSPSLNCRYPGASLADQPRPVVVDPRARWKPDGTPVVKLAADCKALAPWVVSCFVPVDVEESWTRQGGERIFLDEKDIVHACLDHGDSPHTTVLSWTSILHALHNKGIRSVMIEGGAQVINALLAQPDLVDSVIVTIAPTWLGQGGVAVCPAPVTSDGQRVNAARLTETVWRQFGPDAVLCGRTR
jgi:2,5-diamino-6-(ribosylamino)-4(3H)-pyrimidinone 5'-phosphate reductase